MNKLTEIIHPIEGFQYSVNIAYDIYDDKKIASYIPTKSALRIIEDILASTENKSTDRARILTGSYGKGKSHLILYVLAMLAGRNEALFSTVIQKATETNINLARNIQSYLAGKRKLLPVIVNANSLDLKSTLLQSLSMALKDAKLYNLMPATFFDAAIDRIESWERDFPETYKELEKKIGQSGESFILSLKEYEQSSYDLFVKVYPLLTSGSEFNPMSGADVISVYDSVASAIRAEGYNGIFIVYDEFGKFLEGCVDKASSMEIKLIQDLAEKCNRSGENQLHLLLISHKSIENYLSNLPKKKVDSWKAVSNRFKPLSIENDESEIYDIVSTVLARDKNRFNDYVKRHEQLFGRLMKIIEADHSFADVQKALGQDLALRCYPLHPYTLLLLPKISELVAQNERTIFTFLSSTEKYSVPYFLRTNEDEFPIIEPDYIYDYFEKLLKSEPYGSTIKKQWQITTAALSKLKEYDNELAEKIVKTIALIYCVDDFQTVPPSWDIISDIYSVNYSVGEIESAKEVLKNCHLLIELLYRPYVRITAGSGHNAIELIQQEVFRIDNKLTVKAIFNELCPKKYLYPIRYNDENEIIRYFEFRFIEQSELLYVDKVGMALNSDADGMVYGILARTEADLETAHEAVVQIYNERTVFILPNEAVDYTGVAKEYQAIKNLISQYEDKEIELLDELGYILEDRANILKSYIEDTYFRFEKKQSSVYHKGKSVSIVRKVQLQQYLSQIMEMVFSRTPKVVNELINRNELSAAIKSARAKLLNALFANSNQKDLGLQGNGPELNILRSLLIIPGVYVQRGEDYYLEYDCADEKIREILRTINDFILRSDTGRNFSELYALLTKPENHIGLKQGIIPVYLAVAFMRYKEYIILRRRDKELPLSSSVMSDLVSNPEEYTIYLEKWDDDKETYIVNIENIFAQYIRSEDKLSGSFAYLVKAMRRWFLQLTKYEVTTRVYCSNDGSICALDQFSIKFKNALSNSDINAYDFLFRQIKAMCGASQYTEITQLLRTSYRRINETYLNIHRKLIKEARELFNGSAEESLSSVMENFYDDLKQKTKEHSFNGKVNLFLDLVRHPNNDENKLIEAIARILFNLRMSDFTDEIMGSFMGELRAVREAIVNYDHNTEKVNTTGYKIVYRDEDGREITRQFDSAEETDEGDMLYNTLTSDLDDFNESISSDEKRQILFRILKELM